MRRSIRWRFAGGVEDLGLHGRSANVYRPASMTRVQACDTIGHKSSLPAKHVMFVTAQALHDCSTEVAFSHHENQPGTADVFGSQPARLNTLAKFEPFCWSQPYDEVV
jgi:hypothetical protein